MVAGVCLAFSVCAQDAVRVVDKPDVTAKLNDYYQGNKAPLLPSPLIKLPIGSIKPQGWLLKQLELEADGFSGHLTEISSFCKKQGNAWLSKDSVGSGAWEEVPYWFRGFCALGYVLGDQRIITESKEWIDSVIASQREDGYFGPRSNLGNGKGGPDFMPNMSMMYALRSYYEYSGDKRVLDLLTRYFKWQMTFPDKQFFSGGWQVPRNADNMDSVCWLYNITGDAFLLELNEKLMRTGRSWMQAPKDCHNVDFSMGFRKPAQFYQQNHDSAYLLQTEKNYDSIYTIYGQVPGGMFCGDEFARPDYTDPHNAIETCGIVDMMLSQQILLRITGDMKWADRCEDVAINSLPGSMTADMKALRYLSSPNQVNSDARSKDPELADGGPMQLMNPHDHRCCQHNSGMGWPYFAESLWCATPGNGLAAVMYAPSIVTAKVGSGVTVTVTEETKYPFDGRVTFTFKTVAPVAFPFYMRIPAWAQQSVVKLNGRVLTCEPKPGACLLLNRQWNSKDQVTLELPMNLTVKTWTANKNSISVNRGPTTFALKIGEKYVRYEAKRFPDPWPAWEILPSTPWNYALQLDPARPAASFKVVTKAWPTNDMPFTHEGTPVELQVKARKLPNWKEDQYGLVDKLQPSPVKSTESVETVTLIPMGAGRLRLAALPVLGEGPDSREWKLPAEPLCSYSRGGKLDPYDAMFDGKVPDSSNSRKLPRFTTYSFGGAQEGKLHWVQKNFEPAMTVSTCKVFWYAETKPPEGVQLPKWWRVLYRVGKEWKPVENPSGYGIEPDTFNVVTFTPVMTTALRLEVQCQDKPKHSIGIFEWSIK